MGHQIGINIEGEKTIEDVLEGIKVDNYPLNRERDKTSISPRLPKAIENFYSILHQIYHEADRISLSLLRQGIDGINVFRVTDQKEGCYLLRVGELAALEIEVKNSQLYPWLYQASDRVYVTSGQLAALSFVVDSEPSIQRLAEYYKARAIHEIVSTFENYFYSTTGKWYESRHFSKQVDLGELYQKHLGLDDKRIRRSLQKGLPEFEGKTRLFLPDLDKDYLNPVYVISNLSHKYDTFVNPTHGSLLDYDLIVNSNGEVQIVNFGRIDQTHIFRDIALFEAYIKTIFIDDNATLEERISIEETLISKDSFSVSEVKNLLLNDELKKCVAVVASMRQLAAAMTFPFYRFEEYLVALLFAELSIFTHSHCPRISRIQALIGAGLICQNLDNN